MIRQWERCRAGGWWPPLFDRGVPDLTGCNSGVLRLRFKSFQLFSLSLLQAYMFRRAIALPVGFWFLLLLRSAMLAELLVQDPSLAGEVVHSFPPAWEMAHVWKKVRRNWREWCPRAGTCLWSAHAEGVGGPNKGYFSVLSGHPSLLLCNCGLMLKYVSLGISILTAAGLKYNTWQRVVQSEGIVCFLQGTHAWK